MSDDIVRRLRIAHATVTPQVPVLALAADEIELLRAELSRRDYWEWDCPKCATRIYSKVLD